jgi:hypothetical protein
VNDPSRGSIKGDAICTIAGIITQFIFLSL